MLDYQRWVLLRRIRSRRPVLEMLTELWENHFNVPASGDAQCFWRVDFGDTSARTPWAASRTCCRPSRPTRRCCQPRQRQLRPHHPNENLGRSPRAAHRGLAEYGEADVKASARILTGWGVDMWDTFLAEYRTGWHWRGPVRGHRVLHPNADADGRPSRPTTSPTSPTTRRPPGGSPADWP